MTLLSGTSWLPEPAAQAPFVRTAVHGAALDALRAALGGQPGLALVSGGPGTGKTALAHALTTTLAADPAYAVTEVAATRGDLRLLRALLATLDDAQFGSPGSPGRSGLELLTELRARATAFADAGRRAVLLLDNAQTLTGSQLEIVRSLLAIPGGQASPSASGTGEGASNTATTPTIVLFARPELRDRIARRGGLASRRIVSITLTPLDRDDLGTLLRGRAAPGALPFSAAALDALVVASHGIPGRAVPLAMAAQGEALARGWEQVDERIVATVLAGEAALPVAETWASAATGPRPTATQARLPFGDDSPDTAPRGISGARLALRGGEPPAVAGEEGEA